MPNWITNVIDIYVDEARVDALMEDLSGPQHYPIPPGLMGIKTIDLTAHQAMEARHPDKIIETRRALRDMGYPDFMPIDMFALTDPESTRELLTKSSPLCFPKLAPIVSREMFDQHFPGEEKGGVWESHAPSGAVIDFHRRMFGTKWTPSEIVVSDSTGAEHHVVRFEFDTAWSEIHPLRPLFAAVLSRHDAHLAHHCVDEELACNFTFLSPDGDKDTTVNFGETFRVMEKDEDGETFPVLDVDALQRAIAEHTENLL